MTRKTSLINRSAVKKYILAQCAEQRPSLGFTRVSEAALLLLEAKIQDMLRRAVWTHHSKGCTFTDIA